jgi:hypothetical protein
MKKFFLAGVFVLLASTQANAAFISVVKGSDMAGIEVSVTFDNEGLSSSAVWSALDENGGTAIGDGWSLSQSGDTFGDSIFAAWRFLNNSQMSVTSILIDAWAGGFVFDKIEGDLSTNGSGPGRSFVPFDPATVRNYLPSFEFLNPIEGEELYGSLLINFETPFTSGSNQAFFIADTDGVVAAVSAPSVLATLLAALAFVGFARRK